MPVYPYNRHHMHTRHNSYGYHSNLGPNPFGLGLLWSPATRFLLALTVMAFLAQKIFDWMTGYGFTPVFALSWAGIRRLELWQPVTYMFLHGGFWHLLLNMLGLFFLGPETERALGSRRFVRLYLACGLLGGLGWLLISGQQGICVGASGAVLGILAAFAALFPDRPITLLIFFVLPVTMRARTMALGFGLVTLLMMFSQPGHVAHAAHLVGGLAGWLYVALVFNRVGPGIAWDPRRWWHEARWRWERRNFKVVSRSDNLWNDPSEPPADAPPPAEDVDAVLEKISRYGLNSLTDSEREILQRASRRRR